MRRPSTSTRPATASPTPASPSTTTSRPPAADSRATTRASGSPARSTTSLINDPLRSTDFDHRFGAYAPQPAAAAGDRLGRLRDLRGGLQRLPRRRHDQPAGEPAAGLHRHRQHNLCGLVHPLRRYVQQPHRRGPVRPARHHRAGRRGQHRRRHPVLPGRRPLRHPVAGRPLHHGLPLLFAQGDEPGIRLRHQHHQPVRPLGPRSPLRWTMSWPGPPPCPSPRACCCWPPGPSGSA